MTYSEKLKDPRWQKKRLEIMKRDNFTCRWCGDNENTLNIHHLNYEKNKNPWEYEDNKLITICESCHESEHECRKTDEDDLILYLKKFKTDVVYSLIPFIQAVEQFTNYPAEDTLNIITKTLTYNDLNERLFYNFFEYIHKKNEDKINAIL